MRALPRELKFVENLPKVGPFLNCGHFFAWNAEMFGASKKEARR